MVISPPYEKATRLLFRNERATLAVRTFLREAKAGRVVAPPEEECGELEEIVLRPEGEEGQDEEGEKGWPGSP